MRINNPVTQHEYLLPDDATLMSTTDTQSYITYANSAFIDSSGFSEADLMGSPTTTFATLICRRKPLLTCGLLLNRARAGPGW